MLLYAVAVSGSGVALGAGVGVAVAGGGVDVGVGADTAGVGGGGGGVRVATTATPAFTTDGEDVALAMLPCLVANWLTTNAVPRTLIPSPMPIAALPSVRSADRTSAESRTRPRPVPRSLPENVPWSLQPVATHSAPSRRAGS